MIGARLPNWLGDALLARRAVNALARRHGASQVVAAAPAALLDLLSAIHPGVAWLPAARGLGAARELARAWRARGVRTAYVFPTSLSAQLAAAWSGAAERVGFARRPGEWREPEAGIFLTRRVARGRRGTAHLEDEYLALVGGLPRADGGEPLRLALPPCPAAGEVAAPYLAVAPGARYGPAKRWPAERFAEAARALLARGIARGVAVVGEAADREACDAVAGLVGPAARSLAGRTSLLELTALLAGAAAVLVNDSGTAHLSAALGTPTAILFSSTDPAWTAPRGHAVRVLSAALACKPCFRRRCPWRDDAYACQRLLEPAAVAAATAEIAGTRVA